MTETLHFRATPEQVEAYRVHRQKNPVSARPKSPAVTMAPGKRDKTREAAQQAAFPCPHRGTEVIRHDTGNVCGARGVSVAIFGCALHGECSLGRYCHGQTVRACNRCSDRPTEQPAPPFPQDRGGRSPFAYDSRKLPEFVTTSQMMIDLKSLAEKIPPDTSRIVGVARSGVCAASMIAMLLHLPLSIVRQSMGDIIDGGNGWRLTGNTGGQGPVVVIDDTVMTGNSFKHIMPIVRRTYPNAISAAVYVNPHARLKPELFARLLPHPHLLEWNLTNSIFSPHTAVDFDGILCADCAPQDDDDGDRYRGFLLTATPRYMFRRTRIPLIVTARLERWRAETLQWLAWHGMAADRIIMGPWKDNRERARDDIGAWKGGHFAEFLRKQHRIKPAMFIESDPRQAKRIAEVSRGLVVCPAAGRCFLNGAT
jgi:orotate phosphoribosyltransferase